MVDECDSTQPLSSVMGPSKLSHMQVLLRGHKNLAFHLASKIHHGNYLSVNTIPDTHLTFILLLLPLLLTVLGFCTVFSSCLHGGAGFCFSTEIFLDPTCTLDPRGRLVDGRLLSPGAGGHCWGPREKAKVGLISGVGIWGACVDKPGVFVFFPPASGGKESA